jgi:integrase
MATEKRLYRDLSKEVVRYAAVLAVAREADVIAAKDSKSGLSGTWTFWDTHVAGLRVTFGRHRITFSYFKQRRVHGKRSTTAITLGHYPVLSVADARKLALQEAGKIAANKISPGQRTAIKVAAAIEKYIDHLRTRKAGSRWADNAASLARVHILPEFSGWPLSELSAAPAVVSDWHKKIGKRSPVAANHAARLLRAVYRRAARLDRSLPPHLPTSAVEFFPEQRSQDALAPADFPKWKAQWDLIESPIRKSYQMIGLLSGMRPGELARLKWSDVLPRQRCFVIRGAKANNDVRVPMSAAIAREFKRARDGAKAEKIESEWVFPARAGGHIVKFDVDGLPAWGMMYRRTWRTIAADVGVDELLAHFCLGHIPAGISRGYVVKMTLASGQGMRAAQRAVSRRMLALMRA